MVAIMNTDIVQKQFSFESDIPYIDLRSRACANLDLDPADAELGYKITGLSGLKASPSALACEEDFANAMARIGGMISRARTKEYGIKIVNLVSSISFYGVISSNPHLCYRKLPRKIPQQQSKPTPKSALVKMIYLTKCKLMER